MDADAREIMTLRTRFQRFDGVWLLLTVLVVVIHAARIGSLPLRGEETRRGQIAVEMITTGDWIVPRQQGEPFLSRPPLQNWLIALTGLVRGGIDLWAIRLPSLAALLLTSLLIYGYGKVWMSRGGAFTAALAFATMGQVLELGPLGETETLFTLMVSGALLVWHWGYLRGWPVLVTWCAAYALVALGVLTKGPQAPVYFASTVGVFLLLKRRWRFALSWQHAVGITLFLLVWGAWQVPFLCEMGLERTRAIYGGDVALRFVDTRWTTVFLHLATFPFEVFGACLMPWSVLLPAFLSGHVRRLIDSAREPVLFLCIALIVTFPTCWLPPGSRGRYYMPLYPCAALLIGLAADRLRAVDGDWKCLKDWRRFVTGFCAAACLAGVVFAARGLGALTDPLRVLSPGEALSAAVAAVVLAAMLWRLRKSESSRGFIATVACAAAVIGLIWNGFVLSAKLDFPGNLPADAVAQVKEQLPADARLVSIGEIDHAFAFYYGAKIDRVELPALSEAWPPDVEYVCFTPGWNGAPKDGALPVSLKQVVRVPYRTQRGGADRVVVVGRRSPDLSNAAASKIR